MVYAMKMKLNFIKTVMMLMVLPLVATAAASAHQWLNDSNPISVDLDGIVSVENDQLSSARVHTVALNRAGSIEGRIATINAETKQTVGLSDLKIYFVREGEIAQETKTNKEGIFSVDGVGEGVYSFVATGKSGFAAYGVRVVANNGSDQVNVMEAAAVSPRLSVVKRILKDKLPSKVTQEILAATESTQNRSNFVGANRVRLENGVLKGHVVPMLGEVGAVEGTYVHILQNDQQVAEVQADELGSFMVADLEPGVYDFVAAGSNGFAAVSFEAVQEDAEVGSVDEMVLQSDSEEVPAAIPAVESFVEADPMAYQDSIPADIPFDSYDSGYYGDSLDVCLTCGQDQGFVSDVAYGGGDYYQEAPVDYSYSAPIEYAGSSIGCGCASGGSCGSCGDFSGYSSCSSGCGAGGGGGGFFGGAGGGIGGSRLGRLALIGAIAVGIVAIADQPTNPAPVSPNIGS
jgi:hypothetical protein